MNRDYVESRLAELEDEIQSQYERDDLTEEELYMFTKDEKEEVRELQRRLNNFERVEEIFNSLYDTLSDYRLGDQQREDRQTIIETIMQIEEYDDYLDDDDREELSRIKEEIK